MITIHGKQYVTVAERVQMAHEAQKTISITTEVLSTQPVVVKATVTTPKGTFTGISAANPSKAIEKMSPYEVAETSAVGRALGFAGYGAVEGIATADEMIKATTYENEPREDVKSRTEDYTGIVDDGGTVTITDDTPVWKCPECRATKTPFGKVFHKPGCSNQEGRS